MKYTKELLVDYLATQAVSLRIAVVTETFPPEVNGVAMTLGRLVDGLVHRGHSIQLIRPRQACENEVAKLNGVEQVLAPGVPLPTYADLRFGLPSKKRLTQLWSDRRPDIVHVATEGPLGWSAVAAARKLRLPITSSFHTNFHSYSKHYGLSLLKTPIENYLRKLHNRTQVTMVPTRALMLELQQRGFDNVILLARGVASELFSPAKRSQALRKTWGANDGDLVVLLVGRLAKEKNVHLVIEAFRDIHNDNPSAKLVFVGDGPMRVALQAACPCAVFAGVRQGEDLAAHYASGDLFLFPSLTETYGNVVPEALSSGLAVVSYGIAAAQELITSGVNGLLVPVDDEQQFISTAAAIAKDANLLSQFKDAAAPSVSHLKWDSIFDCFVGHLTHAMQDGSAGFDLTAARHLGLDGLNQASA
jgi:glycosyltransferase involved in cell wall biosynthesis